MASLRIVYFCARVLAATCSLFSWAVCAGDPVPEALSGRNPRKHDRQVLKASSESPACLTVHSDVVMGQQVEVDPNTNTFLRVCVAVYNL